MCFLSLSPDSCSNGLFNAGTPQRSSHAGCFLLPAAMSIEVLATLEIQSHITLNNKSFEFMFQNVLTFSSSTLQMFIACRGIPILVGFLEADYAKYRFIHQALTLFFIL